MCAEDALNKILSSLKLEPFYFNDELCMEVDDVFDFKIARRFLEKEEVIGEQ